MEHWAEIRRLHRAEGMGIKAIARRLGIARNTERDALRSTQPPRYHRASSSSLVDVVDAEIRRLLGEFPSMPATVIAERIGWPHGMTILKERVRELRPLFVPPDPCQRTSYRPGEPVQWDLWQPDVAIPLGVGQFTSCGWSRPCPGSPGSAPAGWSRHVPPMTSSAAYCRSSPRSAAAPAVRVGPRGLHRPMAPGSSTSDRRVSGVPWHARCRGQAVRAG